MNIINDELNYIDVVGGYTHLTNCKFNEIRTFAYPGVPWRLYRSEIIYISESFILGMSRIHTFIGDPSTGVGTVDIDRSGYAIYTDYIIEELLEVDINQIKQLISITGF